MRTLLSKEFLECSPEVEAALAAGTKLEGTDRNRLPERETLRKNRGRHSAGDAADSLPCAREQRPFQGRLPIG